MNIFELFEGLYKYDGVFAYQQGTISLNSQTVLNWVKLNPIEISNFYKTATIQIDTIRQFRACKYECLNTTGSNIEVCG